MTLYDELGVASDATPDEIKAAYRRQAQKRHPDKAGGSHADFQNLQQAYDVLSDAARRARYDATGAVDDAPTKQEQAMGGLAAMLREIVANPSIDLEKIDILKLMRGSANDVLAKLHAERNEIERRIARHQKALGRLKHKQAKGGNFLAQALQESIAGLKQQADQLSQHLDIAREMPKLLDAFSYMVDEDLWQALGGQRVSGPFTTHTWRF